LDVIKSIEIVTNRKVSFDFAPRRPGDPAILISSSRLAQNELGWLPRYQDLESIVYSAWKWHRANLHGYEDDTDSQKKK
jgi:UDP-glucose 4-epimerase